MIRTITHKIIGVKERRLKDIPEYQWFRGILGANNKTELFCILNTLDFNRVLYCISAEKGFTPLQADFERLVFSYEPVEVDIIIKTCI